MKDYYSFAHTTIGYSHISSKKPCQDYSIRFQNDVASVIVVSDGHGSSNFTRSDRGSKFACEVTMEAVNGFLQDLNLDKLEDESLRDDVVIQLCKHILLQWNTRVEEDVSNCPFTEAEVKKVADKYKAKYLNGDAVEHAYGCTLMFVIVTHDFCLAVRNGDGQCVTVDCDGSFATPIPWNDNCEFNVTTSLCDQEAIENFRYYYSTKLPAAVYIGSDGVDDSYTSVEELYNLYRNICLKALNDGGDAVTDYVEILLPEITKRGSTDDVSIAGLINPAMLEDAKTAMEIAIELRQMQLAEARREQQKRILIRDIKVAEKKMAKALAQRQDVRQKLHGMQVSQTSIFEQISIFRRNADACRENLASLVQEEKKLSDIVNGVDRDIVRLKSELLALEGGKEDVKMADSKAPLTIETVEGVGLEIDDLSGYDESDAVEPETEDASIEQDTEDEYAVQEAPADSE
ncbi:MAG: protein phosphatase 2C domain-containing protein [Lachnospiraceae bacterium]|nr:protein phosphatase 2C domain-containing protein [Lachnospiraceae bacterium]